MPITPLAAAAIQQGGSLLNTAGNFVAQSLLNRKMRKYNEYMYDKERTDSLADYHMQNQYNHPSSQMARLREAGLNPNLVYGNGADAQGGTVRSTDHKGWSPKVPEVDFKVGDTLGAYYDTQVKQAQIDNLRMQNTVLEKEAILKSVGALVGMTSVDKTKLDIKSGEFDLLMKNILKETNIEARKFEVEKLGTEIDKNKADTSLTLTKDQTERLMQQPNLEKVVQEIISIRKHQLLTDSIVGLNKIEKDKKLAEIEEIEARVRNLRADGELKDFELFMKNLRGRFSDMPWFIKVFTDLFKEIIPTKR